MAEWQYSTRLGGSSSALNTVREAVQGAQAPLRVVSGLVQRAADLANVVLAYQRFLTLADPARAAMAAADAAVNSALRELLSDGAYLLVHSNLADVVTRNGVGAYLPSAQDGNNLAPAVPPFWSDVPAEVQAKGLDALAEFQRLLDTSQPPAGFDLWLASVTQAFYDAGDADRPRSLPGIRLLSAEDVQQAETFGVEGLVAGTESRGRFGALVLTVSGHDPARVLERFALIMRLFGALTNLRGLREEFAAALSDAGADFTSLAQDWSIRLWRGAAFEFAPEVTSPSVSPDFVRLSTADLFPSLGTFSLSLDNLLRTTMPPDASFEGVQDLIDTLVSLADRLTSVPEEALKALEDFLTLIASLGGEKLWIDVDEGGVERLIDEISTSSSTRRDTQVVVSSGGGPAAPGDYVDWEYAEALRATYPGFSAIASDRLIVMGSVLVVQEGPLCALLRELFGRAEKTPSEVAADAEARAEVELPKTVDAQERFAPRPGFTPQLIDLVPTTSSSDTPDRQQPGSERSTDARSVTKDGGFLPCASAEERALCLSRETSAGYTVRDGAEVPGVQVYPPSFPVTATTSVRAASVVARSGAQLPLSSGERISAAVDPVSALPGVGFQWEHTGVVSTSFADIEVNPGGLTLSSSLLDAWLLDQGADPGAGDMPELLGGRRLELTFTVNWTGPSRSPRPGCVTVEIVSATEDPGRTYTLDRRLPRYPVIAEEDLTWASVVLSDGGSPCFSAQVDSLTPQGVTFEAILLVCGPSQQDLRLESALQVSVWGHVVDGDRVLWPRVTEQNVLTTRSVSGEDLAFPVSPGATSLRVASGDVQEGAWPLHELRSAGFAGRGRTLVPVPGEPGTSTATWTQGHRGLLLQGGFRSLTGYASPRVFIGLGRVEEADPVPVGVASNHWEGAQVYWSGDWVFYPVHQALDASYAADGEAYPSARLLAAHPGAPFMLALRSEELTSASAQVFPVSGRSAPYRDAGEGMSLWGGEVCARGGTLPPGHAAFSSLPPSSGYTLDREVPNLMGVRDFPPDTQGRHVEVYFTPTADWCLLPEGRYALMQTRYVEVGYVVSAGGTATLDLWEANGATWAQLAAAPTAAPVAGTTYQLCLHWNDGTLVAALVAGEAWTTGSWDAFQLSGGAVLGAAVVAVDRPAVDGLPYPGATLRIGRKPAYGTRVSTQTEIRYIEDTLTSVVCHNGCAPASVQRVIARIPT